MNILDVQKCFELIKDAVNKMGDPSEVNDGSHIDTFQVGDLFVSEMESEPVGISSKKLPIYEVFGVKSTLGGSPRWDDPPDELDELIGQFDSPLEAVLTAVLHSVLEDIRNKLESDSMYKEWAEERALKAE